MSNRRQPPRRPGGRPVPRRRRRWWRRPVALLLLLPGLGVGFAGVVLFFYFFASVPLPAAIGMSPTVILDQAGREIATLQPEASREDIALPDLPGHVVHAVLAAEDAGFYRHGGISVAGIFRAAVVNVMSGRIAQGGSTISQQYIKNVTADTEQTTLRKIREAALAVKLERQFSKDEILEFYLNTIYFGRGAYGIQAAARAYYDKPATELSLAEAAQLTAVLPAPSVLDPLENPERAHRRYRHVLTRMAEEGWLSAGEVPRLSLDPPRPVERRAFSFRKAPHFLALVQRDLAQRLGDEQVYRGLRVTTSLDLGVQEAAERAFREGFADVAAAGAMVALDPGTGGIRAMVGGKAGEQLNLAVDSRRHAGSTFKTLALAAWVEHGKSPESRFPAPGSIGFDLPGGQRWEVSNYGGTGYGSLTLREATWRSVNTVYAQLGVELGGAAIADIANRAGIRRDLPDLPSLALGAVEVSPLELATAYNTFATGGIRHAPLSVLEVERDGTTLYRAPIRDDRAFSEQVAWTVTEALQGVISSGTGRNAALGRPAAGKTGTSQNHADAWFAGYTPHLTAVVWMGTRDSREPMEGNPTGGGVPARVWSAFMQEALAGVDAADFPRPGGSLEVVGQPSPEPTDEPPPDCPEGQEAVRLEEPGDPDAGDPEWACADPQDSEADGEDPDVEGEEDPEGSEPSDTEPDDSVSPSPSPSPTEASPSPAPSPSPAADEDEEEPEAETEDQEGLDVTSEDGL